MGRYVGVTLVNEQLSVNSKVGEPVEFLAPLASFDFIIDDREYPTIEAQLNRFRDDGKITFTIIPEHATADGTSYDDFRILPPMGADNVQEALDILKNAVITGPVPSSRRVDSGAGLIGGGDLTADRTLAVGAPLDGSIAVFPDFIQIGTLASDTQHGNLGGGLLHAVATLTVAGFMSAPDKVKLDGFPSNPVPSTRQVIAGVGLTGGGALSADVTLSAKAHADGSIVVTSFGIQVGVLATDDQHGSRDGGALHSTATTLLAGFMSAADKQKLDLSGELTTLAPQPIHPSDTGSAGSAGTSAHADHVHAAVAGVPVSVGVSNQEGDATSFSRSNHVHDHGSQAGGGLHALATLLSSGFMSAADKAKLSALLSAKAGKLVPGDFLGTPKKATVTFATPFADVNYTVQVTVVTSGGYAYAPVVESQQADSFVVNLDTVRLLGLTRVNWAAMTCGEAS